MKRPLKILFVHNYPTRFIKLDQELLAQQHEVTEAYFPTPKINPVYLWHLVKQHDLVFGWFASWHTLLPVLFAKILKKPSIVVVGGYDTANLPEAGYGSQRGGLRRFIARTVINKADCLLPFSESAKQELLRNTNPDIRKIKVVHIGVPDLHCEQNHFRERVALTVGGVWQENLYRKGLLPFVQTAHYLPDVRFVLAGRWFDRSIEILRQSAGENVIFTDYLPDHELQALYCSTSVYVQASLHEGFGMSVAEAMLAGCIPVVTRAGSLPEVVGDDGVYVSSPNPVDLASAIQCALTMGEEKRVYVRQRIRDEFSLEKRREGLLNILQHAQLSLS